MPKAGLAGVAPEVPAPNVLVCPNALAGADPAGCPKALVGAEGCPNALGAAAGWPNALVVEAACPKGDGAPSPLGLPNADVDCAGCPKADVLGVLVWPKADPGVEVEPNAD